MLFDFGFFTFWTGLSLPSVVGGFWSWLQWKDIFFCQPQVAFYVQIPSCLGQQNEKLKKNLVFCPRNEPGISTHAWDAGGVLGLGERRHHQTRPSPCSSPHACGFYHWKINQVISFSPFPSLPLFIRMAQQKINCKTPSHSCWITKWSGLAGPSVGHPVQPPAEAGSPRAGCTGPHPGG